MHPELDFILIESHLEALRKLLARPDGKEASAYLLLGKANIAADPWSGAPRLRLISHEVVPVPSSEVVSASALHITWSTEGFMRLLSEARQRNLVACVVHTHPGSSAFFSEQDDRNEAELARTAANKGLALGSIVLGGDGSIAARLWHSSKDKSDAVSLSIIGNRIDIRRRSAVSGGVPFLARQAALFRPDFNPLVRSLRVTVIGGGGTGSAVAMLLNRLGVGFVAIVDRDVVEDTNLNRVHGSRMEDVGQKVHKVDIIAREIALSGLGCHVVTRKHWVGEPEVRDLLRASDVVIGCTDDHHGRLTVNRLSYFYGIPLIDVGLRMRSARSAAEYDMVGRVSVVRPGSPCLLCLGTVDPKRAADEALKRSDPAEFQRRKAEAYVADGGEPAPAVVTFTTSVACLAIDELINGLTGFRGATGMAHNLLRRFDKNEQRSTTCTPADSCPICASQRNWGRGDIKPFLGVMG